MWVRCGLQLRITHLEPDARFAAEAAAVGVVGTAKRSLGDGVLAGPVVAVHGVPDNEAAGRDVAEIISAKRNSKKKSADEQSAVGVVEHEMASIA